MISRDYTKEVGISSQKKNLPRPVAFILLAVVAAGVWFGVSEVVAKSKEHRAVEKSPAGAAAHGVHAAPAANSAPAK